MIIKLRDEEREFESGVSVLDVASSISEGLARVAVCGKIGDELVDLEHKINSDCNLEIITNKSEEYKEVFVYGKFIAARRDEKRLYTSFGNE